MQSIQKLALLQKWKTKSKQPSEEEPSILNVAAGSNEPLQGWLWRKWDGKGKFWRLASAQWQRVWCVLDGAFLYFHDNHAAMGAKARPKAVLAIHDANVMLVPPPAGQSLGSSGNNSEIENRPAQYAHCIELSHGERRTVWFACDSAEDKRVWAFAMSAAAQGPVNAPPTLKPYWEALGITASVAEETCGVGGSILRRRASVTRAYRRAALKAHPDRGGDVDKFKVIVEAYEVLSALCEAAGQEAQDFEEVHFFAEQVPLLLFYYCSYSHDCIRHSNYTTTL